MKFLLAVFFLSVSFASFAQNNGKDTTITCVANWKKGEEKTLLISRKKQSTGTSKNEQPFTIKYEADLKILNATDTGYLIQWSYRLGEDFTKEFPEVAAAMAPIYGRLKMQYTTEKSGEFKELLNWEEVRDVFVGIMQLPTDTSGRIAEALNKAKEMFSTREMVENVMIREIQLYHSIYAGEFSTKDFSDAGLLSNPLGGNPIPAIIKQKITEINSAQDYYTVELSQEIDKQGAVEAVKDVLKKMGVSKDTLAMMTNEVIGKLEITDKGKYIITTSTGWISFLQHERIAANGGMKQEESYVFEMKKD